MDKEQIIFGIESRARKIGIPVYALCREAGVNVSIVSKWKAGSDPRLGTLKRITDKLDELERERAA